MKDATATHATDATDATSALAAKDHQDELSEERESTSPAGRRRRRGGRRRGGRRHRRNRYNSPADWTVEDVSRWIKEVKDGAFATSLVSRDMKSFLIFLDHFDADRPTGAEG